MRKKSLIVGYDNIGRTICSFLESSKHHLELFGILDKKYFYSHNKKKTHIVYCELKDLPEPSDDVLFVEMPDIIIITDFSLETSKEIFDYAKKNKIPVFITTKNGLEYVTKDLEAIQKFAEDIPIGVYRYHHLFDANFIATQTIDGATRLVDCPIGYYNKADLEND